MIVLRLVLKTRDGKREAWECDQSSDRKPAKAREETREKTKNVKRKRDRECMTEKKEKIVSSEVI